MAEQKKIISFQKIKQEQRRDELLEELSQMAGKDSRKLKDKKTEAHFKAKERL